MTEFNVGDRVRAKHDPQVGSRYRGLIGTIAWIPPTNRLRGCYISFDTPPEPNPPGETQGGLWMFDLIEHYVEDEVIADLRSKLTEERARVDSLRSVLNKEQAYSRRLQADLEVGIEQVSISMARADRYQAALKRSKETSQRLGRIADQARDALIEERAIAEKRLDNIEEHKATVDVLGQVLLYVAEVVDRTTLSNIMAYWTGVEDGRE